MIMKAIYTILISLDAIVYSLVGHVYKLFLILANTNIFDINSYNDLVKRIYIILGVVMLFMLSYSMLRAVINPDEFSKGDNSPGKIVTKTISSLVIIVILPFVFSVASNVQIAVLNSNFLGKVILGVDSTSSSLDTKEDLKNYGHVFSSLVFQPFFSPNLNAKVCGDAKGEEDCATQIISSENKTLHEVNNTVSTTGNFFLYTGFADKVQDEVRYMFLISTACGLFLLYVMVSFCFDLAIRVAKLALLQVIAPIPVIARIMPGSTKDIFSNWVKKIVAVFLEVFIRVVIMYFGVFLITMFTKSMLLIFKEVLAEERFLGLLAIAFVVMGIVAFIRQAPKLISELFPQLDSSSIKLGIAEKLTAGGGFAVGAGLGAAATLGVRGVAGERGFRRVTSGLSGLATGLAGGTKHGFSAKTFSEMNKSVSSAASAVAEKKQKRAFYKASHPEGVLRGKAADMMSGIKEWAGVDVSSLEAIREQKQLFMQAAAVKGDLFDATEDEAIVMGANARLEAHLKNSLNRNDYTNEDDYKTALASYDDQTQMLKDQLEAAKISALNEMIEKGHGKVMPTLAAAEALYKNNKGNPAIAEMGAITKLVDGKEQLLTKEQIALNEVMRKSTDPKMVAGIKKMLSGESVGEAQAREIAELMGIKSDDLEELNMAMNLLANDKSAKINLGKWATEEKKFIEDQKQKDKGK